MGKFTTRTCAPEATIKKLHHHLDDRDDFAFLQAIEKLDEHLPAYQAHELLCEIIGHALSGMFEDGGLSLVSALVQSPFGAKPLAGYSAPMHMAIEAPNPEIILVLHEAGFALDKHDTDQALTLIRALMKSHWPYPELIWPDILDCPYMESVYTFAFEFNGNNEDDRHELCVDQINRLNRLSHKTPPIEGFTFAFLSMGHTPSNAKDLISNPERLEALLRLRELGWLDEPAIAQKGVSLWDVLGPVVEALNAFEQSKKLSQSTPLLAPAKSRPRI